MLLSEQEAKGKLCPRAMGPGELHWEMVPKNRLCVGSNCMAWRWWLGSGDPNTDRSLGDDRSRGFCGLAGNY